MKPGLPVRASILRASTSPPSLAAAGKSRKVRQVMVGGLNSFQGLKAHNRVSVLGVPIATEMAFAKVVSSLRSKGKGGGGALGTSCSVAGEIFNIAATMNGLVLVGVAVGFVLLRIEASVEEAEAAE